MAKSFKNEYANATPKRKSQLNEATKKWRANNPEKIREIRKRSDAKRKTQRRDRELKKKYGISFETYIDMLQKQQGVCAICKRPETKLDKGGNIRPLCVDHCHVSGKVRGLLCASCNLALGNLEDNVTYFLNAISYLEEHHGS
jgi:hypothetical protein